MPDTQSRRRWWTLAVVSFTQLLIVLDGTIVNVALPTAQVDLGLSDSARQWVVTAYALAFGSFLLLGGRVADYWGRKRTYLLALAVFGASSAWGGLTHSGAELLAARGLQGLAAAFLAPSALAIVTITFPSGAERNRAFAIFGSLAGAGSAIGMVLGGLLTDFFSWRWCLLVNVPLIVVGIVAGAALLTESRADGDRRYDVAGALACTLGFGALVYGLTLAEGSWLAPAPIALVGLGALLLGGFVLIEHRSANPLLPLRVLRHRTRAAAFVVQALMGAAGAGSMLYLAFHLQLVLHLPPRLAGVATLPFTVSLMAMVPYSTRLMDRVGPRRQLVAGPLVSAAGLLWLARITVDGDYWTQILPGVVLMGLGMGLAVVPLQNLALLGIQPRDAGVAAAASNASNQLGSSVGLALLTAVYVTAMSAAGPVGSANGPAGSASAVVAGHAAVFVACAALYAAIAAVAWRFVGASALAEGHVRPDAVPYVDAVTAD